MPLMRTPFGQECRYYYADFYRGRSAQECRLVASSSTARDWSDDLCRYCPVPAILRANGCPHMQLEGRVARGFLGFGRHMQVAVTCRRSQRPVAEPHVGCGQCHLDSVFASALGEE